MCHRRGTSPVRVVSCSVGWMSSLARGLPNGRLVAQISPSARWLEWRLTFRFVRHLPGQVTDGVSCPCRRAGVGQASREETAACAAMGGKRYGDCRRGLRAMMRVHMMLDGSLLELAGATMRSECDRRTLKGPSAAGRASPARDCRADPHGGDEDGARCWQRRTLMSSSAEAVRESDRRGGRSGRRPSRGHSVGRGRSPVECPQDRRAAEDRAVLPAAVDAQA